MKLRKDKPEVLFSKVSAAGCAVPEMICWIRKLLVESRPTWYSTPVLRAKDNDGAFESSLGFISIGARTCK
jgi:hypothetical protein